MIYKWFARGWIMADPIPIDEVDEDALLDLLEYSWKYHFVLSYIVSATEDEELLEHQRQVAETHFGMREVVKEAVSDDRRDEYYETFSDDFIAELDEKYETGVE